MDKRKYYGKVILFGEYSMIYGASALLIPYYNTTAEWNTIMHRPSEKAIDSNNNLYQFLNYLNENDKFRILDLKRFEMELNAGLFFDSNIPLGYGVGSSGALVAAIYDRYKLTEIEDAMKLKSFLAAMESYFHGSSSGVDPLQCFFGKPFVLSQQTTDNSQQPSFTILDSDFISENIHIFLIDTKIKSPTGPLVERFKELRNDDNYRDKFDNEYVPLVNECIDSLIEKQDDNFFEKLSKLSMMQTELLTHTIPNEVREFFYKSLKEDYFQVKQCGAGGGGFLLGFTNDVENTNNYWKKSNYNIIWIE